MRSQFIVLLVVGLVASTHAYHLSDAKKRSIESDARLFNALQDFFNQVVHPPLNHVVQSLALMGAQVLAGISQTGIPTIGGRTVHLSEPQLRGIFDDLWQNVVKPPIEQALQGLSLMAAQVLAGVGTNGINLSNIFGKRDLNEDEARFLDTLTQVLGNLFTSVVQKPLEQALQTSALMAAQVLAGIGTNGINLSNILGKQGLSEDEARFLDTITQVLGNLFTSVVQKPLEQALQTSALMAAQVLAGIGTNGINLSNILGKQDLSEDEARFLDTVMQTLGNLFTSVVQKPLEQALQTSALMAAQVLAEQALQTSALMAAQVLAGVGTNGINLSNIFGKRDLNEDEARFLDTIAQTLSTLFSSVVQKPLEQALQTTALMAAQVLAGIGTNGINLSNILGRQDLSELAGRQEELRGFFDSLGQNLLNGLQSVWTNVIQGPVEQALQSGALMAAQVLAGIGTTGVNLGKRELNDAARGELVDNLVNHASGLYQNQLKPVIENALNSAVLHLAGVLANFSQTGIGRR
ncbi:unnamed protein product [Rotaria sp. Silwood1]|nr:unnamed protein product [Rotaria sp. Silwood1]